jgi:hypothetical protein
MLFIPFHGIATRELCKQGTRAWHRTDITTQILHHLKQVTASYKATSIMSNSQCTEPANKVHKIIKLLDSTGLQLLDSVACEYEDSFGLEDFGSLTETFVKQDKQFVIARVRTVDPKQPDKVRWHAQHALLAMRSIAS